jgi:hypothetical protein
MSQIGGSMIRLGSASVERIVKIELLMLYNAWRAC